MRWQETYISNTNQSQRVALIDHKLSNLLGSVTTNTVSLLHLDSPLVKEKGDTQAKYPTGLHFNRFDNLSLVYPVQRDH